MLLLKPFQPDFDSLLNPGRQYKNSSGTLFLYQFIRLHISQYPHSLDKFQFRVKNLSTYMRTYQRGLYWRDEEESQFIPILSISLAARCSRKIFENIQASVYRHLPLHRFILNKKARTIKTEKKKLKEDAYLLLSNARKMHQMMLAQFCSPERVEKYTEILKSGVGQGVYACQEKAAFEPIVELFPGLLECSGDDDDDDPDFDEHTSAQVSSKSRRQLKSMKEAVQEIETQQAVVFHNSFPSQKITNRAPKPRLHINSHCFIIDNSRKVYVKLVQVLRKNVDSNALIYVLKSPSKVSPVFFAEIPETLFLDKVSSGIATTFDIAGCDISTSSLTSDIFTTHLEGIFRTFPYRHFPSTLIRKKSFEDFYQQSQCKLFVSTQREFFSSLQHLMDNCSFHTEQLSLRVGWSQWVPTKVTDRWFPWQIVSLLLLTNSVHDKIVCDIVSEMFSKFPNPIVISENPVRFIDFLTSQAKGFQPMSPDYDPMVHAIKKGPNYCYQKASYIVAMSKLVVISWCYRNVPTVNFYSLETLRSMYCDHTNLNSLSRPLPEHWLQAAITSSDTFFPSVYSHNFFSDLPGVGLKMRHLCSESIYADVIGPAIDCHCIRFAVEFGVVHAGMCIEQMSRSLLMIYEKSHIVSLNEIPATISQVLTNQNKDTNYFVDAIIQLAKEHGLDSQLRGFMSHYPKLNCPTTS